MKISTITLTTTIAILAISAAMVLACSSADSTETTEQQNSAAQPIATLETTATQAPAANQITTTTEEVNSNTNANPSSNEADSSGTANNSGENPTVERPAFATQTPETSSPVATPTREKVTQQDGAVILARPTPTPTPVPTPTSTPRPPDTPYWKLFNQAQYDEFLPPAGPIDWTTPKDCASKVNTMGAFLHDSTPQGILDRIEWNYDWAIGQRGGAFSTLTVERAQELDWERFGTSPKRISSICGHVHALHPQIPVVRATFNLNVSTGDWTDPKTGEKVPVVKAYRLEARYIYAQDGSGYPDIEPLGPILIEPLGSFCDRDDIIEHDQSQPACNVPGN